MKWQICGYWALTFLMCGTHAISRACEVPDTVLVRGAVVDAETKELIPARVHVRSQQGTWHFVQSDGGHHVHYERHRPQIPKSQEFHTTLSPDPFVVELTPGNYTFRIERGKEYLPIEQLVEIRGARELKFRLQRWINMSDRHWYSGDTHVHRSLAELPNVMLAEDLNVALTVDILGKAIRYSAEHRRWR